MTSISTEEGGKIKEKSKEQREGKQRQAEKKIKRETITRKHWNKKIKDDKKKKS